MQYSMRLHTHLGDLISRLDTDGLGETGLEEDRDGYPRGGSRLREAQARDIRVHSRGHAGPGVGQGPRPGGLRRTRRRVPRRVADRGPVPSALRAGALSRYVGARDAVFVNSGSSANLCALSALTSPKLAGNKKRFGKGPLQPGDEVLTVAAGFPTTVNPIIQNRIAAGRRRHRAGHLRRHPGAAARGRRAEDAGDHDGAHPGQSVRSGHGAGAVRGARPVAGRGLVRRARLDLRRQTHRQLRRHRDGELLPRPPHHHRRGWRGVRQVATGPQAGRVVPRLGPGLLLRAGKRQHLREAVRVATRRPAVWATTTSTSTATSDTT